MTKWTWAFPFFQYTSTCFFLQEEKDLCGSVHNLPTLVLNFGSKLYKPLQVWGSFCRHSRRVMVVLGSKLYKPLQGSKRHLRPSRPKMQLWFKVDKIRRGTPALYRPQVFPSYDHPIPGQVLTFGEFIFAFSLYEMSLDISNPCGNSRRVMVVLGSKLFLPA